MMMILNDLQWPMANFICWIFFFIWGNLVIIFDDRPYYSVWLSENLIIKKNGNTIHSWYYLVVVVVACFIVLFSYPKIDPIDFCLYLTLFQIINSFYSFVCLFVWLYDDDDDEDTRVIGRVSKITEYRFIIIIIAEYFNKISI